MITIMLIMMTMMMAMKMTTLTHVMKKTTLQDMSYLQEVDVIEVETLRVAYDDDDDDQDDYDNACIEKDHIRHALPAGGRGH